MGNEYVSKNKYISEEEVAALVDEQMPELRSALINALYHAADDYSFRTRWAKDEVNFLTCDKDNFDSSAERYFAWMNDTIDRFLRLVMRDMNNLEREKSPKFNIIDQ